MSDGSTRGPLDQQPDEPGWWMASDNKWYPPERASRASGWDQPTATTPVQNDANQGGWFRRNRLPIVVGAVALFVGVMGGYAAAGSQQEEIDQQAAQISSLKSEKEALQKQVDDQTSLRAEADAKAQALAEERQVAEEKAAAEKKALAEKAAKKRAAEKKAAEKKAAEKKAAAKKKAAAAKAKAAADAAAAAKAAADAAASPPPTQAVVQPPPAAYYGNCSEARAAGAAPLYRGEPGYSSNLDRDGDGVACE